MTYASQFAGGAPVGSMMTMSDLGPTVTLADNTIWMRNGVVTTAASAPILATLPQYKIVGGTASTITKNTTYNPTLSNKMASNGTGVIIALTGATYGTIIKSTDYGATWTPYTYSSSIGLANNTIYNDIVYANGKFILIGQNTYTSIYNITYSSNNGTSWTTFTLTNPTDWTNQSGSPVPYNNGCQIVWTGTYFVAAGIFREPGGNSNAIYTFYLGTGGTSAASGVRISSVYSATSGDPAFDYYATGIVMNSNGADGIVIGAATNGQATKWAYSANYGTTWTFYTVPTGYVYSGVVYIVGTKVILSTTTNSTAFYVYNTPSSTPTLVNLDLNTTQLLLTGNTTGSKVFGYNHTLQQILEFDTTTYTTVVTTKQLLGTLGASTSYPGAYYNQYTQYIDNKFVSLGAELGVASVLSYTSDFSNYVYYGVVKANRNYYVRIS